MEELCTFIFRDMSGDGSTTLRCNVGRVVAVCQRSRCRSVHSQCCENLRSHKIHLSDGSQTWKMFCLTVKIYSNALLWVPGSWASLQWAVCLTDCIMKFKQYSFYMYFYILIHACSSSPYPVQKPERKSVSFNLIVNFVFPGQAVAQLFEATRHETEGSGFDSRWGPRHIQVT